MLSRLPRRLLFLLCIASSALFFWLAFRKLDVGEVLRATTSATLWPWLPLAIGCYLLGHLVRGVRTRLLVSRDARISLLSATNVVVLGYAVNNILPARLGELARATMLSERSGISLAQALTVTFLERVLDGLAMVLLLSVAAALVGVGGIIAETRTIAMIIFACATFGVLLFVMLPDRLARWTSKIANSFSARWHDRLLRLVISVANGVAYLRRPQDALVIGLLSLLVWIVEAGLFFCRLPALGLQPNIWHAMLAMTVTNLAIMVPSAPGYVGPFHYACMQTLVLLGTAQVQALSFAIVVHLAFYVPITLWGLGIIIAYGFALASTADMARRARLATTLAEELPVPAHLIAQNPHRVAVAEPSTFFRALVESLIPDDQVAVDARSRATDNVIGFTNRQICSLPPRLRLLFSIGMLAFRCYVVARTLRPFAGQSLTARVKLASSWANSRIGPARQLFRVVRSLVLLGWYEEPAVVEAIEGAGAGDAAEPQKASVA